MNSLKNRTLKKNNKSIDFFGKNTFETYFKNINVHEKELEKKIKKNESIKYCCFRETFESWMYIYIY